MREIVYLASTCCVPVTDLARCVAGLAREVPLDDEGEAWKLRVSLAATGRIRYHVIIGGGEVVARHQVVLFLHLMKTAANERFAFMDRRVNLDTLARLGINRQHAQALVVGLKPEDYVSGPSPDHNYPGLEMWVFGLQVSGSEVYVKIQVIVEPARCVCISFHESERPMHYPFRETEPPANEEEQR